jgi:hypothetical protein
VRNVDYFNCLGKFISLNSYVKEIHGFDSNLRDFSKEMALNDQIVYLEDYHPLSRFYIERNKNLKMIIEHFAHKKISRVKLFDINFQFLGTNSLKIVQ